MSRRATASVADVVVVGGGLAGLVTARELVRAGLEVVVCEARPRVGGRTETVEVAGTWLDVGGQWIGPGQHRMLGLVDELGLSTFPTCDEGTHVMDVDGRLRRFSGAIPPLGRVALLDVWRAGRTLDRMARTVPVDAPWAASQAGRWDAVTFASWLARNVATARGRAFFGVACAAVFATEPANLSLLHVLVYLHAGDGLESLLSVTGGAQQDRVVGGTQQIAQRLAEDLGDRVRTGTPVRAIRAGSGHVEVVTDDGALRAGRAVVAVPPALAGAIRYTPDLPADRAQLLQRMPHGAVLKCQAVYDEPFWRHAGASGQAGGDRSPVGAAFDNTPPGGAPGVLLGFVEGRHALALSRLPEASRRVVVLDAFARWFGPAAREPVAYVERDWQAQVWTRGCYGAHLPPGAWTQLGAALRRPVGRIHWAGTETATRWVGYMEGAVDSGLRAAREVVAAH